jgi:3-oxoisoapionate decarboxylase
MKIGLTGYLAPPEIAPDQALEWAIGEVASLGVEIIGGDARPLYGWDTRQYDLGYLRHVRDLAAARGIEIEPYIRGPFDLDGPDRTEAIAATLASIRAAKILGGPYVRTGFGRLTIATSRFSRETPIAEQLTRMVASLREAARLAQDEGIIIAIENHCDYAGRELASVLAAVDSPSIRAALDTGNSVVVFSDPADDLRVLAPFTVTTHLKDLAVVQSGVRWQVPFRAIGCPLGQGVVDVPGTIRALVAAGPRGRDIPLIAEVGWMPLAPGEEYHMAARRVLGESFTALRGLVASEFAAPPPASVAP